MSGSQPNYVVAATPPEVVGGRTLIVPLAPTTILYQAALLNLRGSGRSTEGWLVALNQAELVPIAMNQSRDRAGGARRRDGCHDGVDVPAMITEHE